MKLALRIAVVALLVFASWWWFGRASSSNSVSAVAPALKSATTNEAAPTELPAASEPTHIAPPIADDARTATATPPPAVIATEATVKSTGLLRVHVVSRETRKPLAGQRVALTPEGVEDGSWRDIQGSHAAVREAPLTDAEGQAELEVDAGHKLTVFVGEGRTGEPTTLAALTAGETRDVEIDVPTEPDRTLFGRLVDAETKQAIANGAVWCKGLSALIVLESGPVKFSPSTDWAIPSDAIRTQSDGTFEMHVRSWEQRFANAKADGYSRIAFAIDASHATPESALEVRLSRAATVEVVVLDGGLAAANADVVLTTESYQLQQNESMFPYFASAPRWTAQADANGRAEIGDLPSRVPLTMSVRVGRTVRTEAEPLTLGPGERKRIEIALGSGASILGRVESSSGAPLAGYAMALVAGEGSTARMLQDYETPIAVVIADAQGRFHFDDVAPGSWLVGLRPQSHRNAASKTGDAIVALAQVVVIDASSRQVDVVIRAEAGLYLRGTVFEPSGAPAANTNVSAGGAGAWLSEHTDDEGRFTLGPVPAGPYTLGAGDFRGAYAMAETVQATAGDSDIVLRLRVGGAIHGRVVDASHQARECSVSVTQEGEEFGLSTTGSHDGTIAFEGLIPATYTVSAKTGDGLCGRRAGLIVRAGETIDNVEIVLEPGARVKLRYDGPERYGQYQILVGGIACNGDGLERGKDRLLVVPTGDVEVRWNGHDPKSMHSQHVTLAAGEERDVVWDGKP